jgi:outer membrane protein assembly factor BamB
MRRVLVVLALVTLLTPAASAIDWPQWLGPQRDGIWREEGLLEKFPEGGLKVLWRMPLGTGYAGPSVAQGKVYVMDRSRKLDAEGKPVKPERGKPMPGFERLVCISAADGKQVWEHKYACDYSISYGSGPRTTPVVNDGKVYMLGAMGDMKCLDAETGKIVWEKSLPKEYGLRSFLFDLKALDQDAIQPSLPIWGYASHLLVDGKLLYSLVGGPGSSVVAFDKQTGKEVWRALSAQEVCYAPPMIYTVGGTRQLIIWLDTTVNGLDPATGKVYWSVNHPGVKLQRPAVAIHTPRLLGDKLFLSTFYNGSVLLQITGGEKPSAKVVWKTKSDNPVKPDGLHIMMAPPWLKDDHIYGICAFGELRCLRLSDGHEVWNTLAPTLTKQQYQAAEKRLQRALADKTPQKPKTESKKDDEEPPSTDVSGKPKMKGVDCGNSFIVPLGDSHRCVIFNDQGELIQAEISPGGYHEIDRTLLIEPNHAARGREVVWSHPAFANKCIYARNDKEIICVSMSN